MAPTYKYIYFNVRGRGELVRLIFHAAGVEFTDQRVEFSEWPPMKPNTPYGTLPYIEINGKPFSEYMPICRYLAREFNLMGKNAIEQLESDILLNLILELREAFFRFKMDSVLNDAQKNDLGEKYKTEGVPQFCQRMEKLLTDNKSGYIVGNNLTLSDLALVDIFDQALKVVPDALEKFPKLQAHRDRIQALPKVAKYLAARPVTDL